jgi:hypothetical protein
MVYRKVMVVVIIPACVLIVHELTHLTVAWALGNPKVAVISKIPLRLMIEFPDNKRDLSHLRILRAVAISPVIVGIAIGIPILTHIECIPLFQCDKFYYDFLVWLYWLLYTLPSPADLYSFLFPYKN